jgi:serine protease Do
MALGITAIFWSRPAQPSTSAEAAPDIPSKPTTEPQSVSPDQQESAADFRADDDHELVGLQSRFQTIANRIAPGVVAISAAESATNSDAAVRSQDMSAEMLQDWLRKTTRTVGTGFVFDGDGYILTNEHVIEQCSQLWVTTDDHHVYPAFAVGADPRADLAVLKIPSHQLPVLRLNAKVAAARGQWAITLGNPFGLATEGEMALSVGVISAIDRSLPKLSSEEDRLYSNLIQTTAQINPGNSGGPLLDLDGNVIGINTAVILPQKQTNGIGFAIPISVGLIKEISDLRHGREVIYGYVGVTVESLTPRQHDDFGTGVVVTTVEPGSPAASSIKAGDILLQIDNQSIANTETFIRLVGAASVDRPTRLNVLREGKKQTVSISPIKRPVQYAISQENQRMRWRGATLGPIPTGWGGASGTKHVTGILVITVDDDSPLKSQGIAPGTLITSVAGHAVNTLAEMQDILNSVPADKCVLQTRTPQQVASMRN